MTPEQWLELLAARLEARRPYVKLMRDYTTGNARLPEMGPNLRRSWERFQRKSRTNWGGLAVESRAERIIHTGVTVGGSIDTPEAKAAAEIVLRNRLEVAFADAIEDCMAVGYGYLAVGSDADGRAVVTAEKPEFVIVAQDELQPWRAVAALKVWRHLVDGRDYALLWIPGLRVKYSRPSVSSLFTQETMSAAGGWAESERVAFDGPVPVFELENKTGKSVAEGVYFTGGLSIIDAHTDLVDRITLGVLWRLVTQSIQAFRQRGLFTREGSGGLPETDTGGNAIDWAAVFEPAPGALWEIPEQVAQVWESQYTDITPMLTANTADVREFAALTGATVPGSDAANQSAEGVRDGKDKAARGAEKVLARVKPVLSGAMLAALRVEGIDSPGTIEVKFENPNRVTLAEKTDAASKMIAAGVSLPIVQREILGMSPDTIAEDESNRNRAAMAPSPIASLAAAVTRQTLQPNA